MKIAVYCSSRSDINPDFIHSAQIIGNNIGLLKATLIYGGMDFGLMKIVALSAKSSGGRIVGVVPRTHISQQLEFNDETIIAEDLSDRKSKIMAMSDLFIVLPGGYGTLDEFFTTLAHLSFTNDNSKTIIILNRNNFYDQTLLQLQTMIDNAMMNPDVMQRIKVVTMVEECCNIVMQQYKYLNSVK